MSEILEIQNALHQLLRDLSAGQLFDFDELDYFRHRQLGFAELGLSAASAARELRSLAGVNPQSVRAADVVRQLHKRAIEMRESIRKAEERNKRAMEQANQFPPLSQPEVRSTQYPPS